VPLLLGVALISENHNDLALSQLAVNAPFIHHLLELRGRWPAILADTGATVLLTINALRLLTPRRNV